MPGRRYGKYPGRSRNLTYPLMKRSQKSKQLIKNPPKWVKPTIGIGLVLAFTVPVFRSGLRTNLTLWEWIINHTIMGHPVEYIPEEYYMSDEQSNNGIGGDVRHIRGLEDLKIPTGQKDFGRSLTDQVSVIQFNQPWISFTLRNLGPGDVYCCINEREGLLEAEPIRINRTYRLDMDYPIIKKIYVKAAEGTTADIRISAVQGRQI